MAISKAEYLKLVEQSKKAKGQKGQSIDFEPICLLPQWKTEQRGQQTFYILPLVPTMNTYWRNVQGKVLISKEGRSYKQHVGALALRLGMPLLKGNVKVLIEYHRPQRRGDLDNRQKALLDTLKGIAYIDDEQIVEIHSRRFESPNDGKIIMAVELVTTVLPFGDE
jgi:crossover junction endodeoxyribonuclease RusA